MDTFLIQPATHIAWLFYFNEDHTFRTVSVVCRRAVLWDVKAIGTPLISCVIKEKKRTETQKKIVVMNV